jgi:hypothetical protein
MSPLSTRPGHPVRSTSTPWIGRLLLAAAVAAFSPLSIAGAFEFKGFGDVTFTKSDLSDSEARHGSFALGQFDLYLNQPVGDRVDVLSELVFETDTESGNFGVDLERLQISYLVADWLVLHAGRFHNLLGYWNMAYHHGSQIQTSIERPQILSFEDDGGILPVHLVGLWLSGYAPVGPVLLDYGLMLGNGPKIQDVGSLNGGSLNPNNVSDNSGNKAFAFNLTLHPQALPDLGVGLCGNISQVEGFSTVVGVPVQVSDVSQQIYCGDLTYITQQVELLFEYYAIFDRDRMSATGRHTNQGGYVQAAYTFAQKYVPYVRYEWISADEQDPYMTELGAVDLTKEILGFRYNLLSSSSIKAEVRFVRRPDMEHAHEFAVQWAFWF